MKSTITRWAIPTDPIDRAQAVQQLFPHAKAVQSNVFKPIFVGGRKAAINQLNAVDGVSYGNTRNFTNGAVTRLSPYLRHGCITLKESVSTIRERFGLSAEKLLFEFAWREYWRTVWYASGSAILSDLQAPKVSLAFNPLADDIKLANTGLPCMDSFISELSETGYLHNHARMWLAAYIIHWRKIDWQAAAFWMHDQLLDGDYASNHLSWQWVASTFSSKPYFFNQDNLAKYTNNQYCASCSVECPFKESYANLQQTLFKPTQQLPRRYKRVELVKKQETAGKQTIVWFHDEMLNSEHPLLKSFHQKIFIFDPNYYQNWSTNRLHFIADCLAEMPNVTVWIGKADAVFKHVNTANIITQNTPNLALKALTLSYPTTWHVDESVCDQHLNDTDINSFSRFWKKASHSFLGVANKKKFIKHS